MVHLLLLFICISYTSTDFWGCHCAPCRHLEQRGASAITRWESAIFMSDWTRVEKSIQVTMQCCVSSTRGSSQPSRSPPPRWWGHHFWTSGPTLGLFFSSPGKIGGRLSGLPLEAPQWNCTLITFEKEKHCWHTVNVVVGFTTLMESWGCHRNAFKT